MSTEERTSSCSGGGGCDFIQLLGSDISIKVFLHLDDPSDLVRVCSVSSSWRRFSMPGVFTSPFDVEILDPTGKCTLKYSPQRVPQGEAGATSRWHLLNVRLTERGVRGWENMILSTLLGIRQVDEDGMNFWRMAQMISHNTFWNF